MGKKNIIIITACIIFIVFSGILYLQPGGSKSTSFTRNTGEDMLQHEETAINENGQETEESNVPAEKKEIIQIKQM